MTNQEIKIQAEAKRDTLFTECQLFFAFSNEQFEQNKPTLTEGDKFVSIGAGGYLPKSKARQFIDGMDTIKKWEKAQRKATKEEQKEKHIIDVLNNYECFYAGDIEDALTELLPHYSKEYILQVFNKNYDLQTANC